MAQRAELRIGPHRMPSHNVGHNERLYRKRRAIFRDACRAAGVACYWHQFGTCRHEGAPIIYDGNPRDTQAFSVEHRTPRSTGGSRDDPANWEAAHYGCNSARGNGVTRGIGTRRTTTHTPTGTDPHSEDWP